MKKICVVTATRAEYGVLRNLIHQIDSHEETELCLVVMGAHLSERLGNTIDEIRKDGFPIAEQLHTLMDADSPDAVSKSMGITFFSFSDVLKRHNPDMLVVLGDRYEMIPICCCALNAQIPIAHISGGEITEGAIDDCIRHCITKMSTLHFPGCEVYRQRIIQLGEQPDSVFNYGDIGVENIMNMQSIPFKELEDDLGIRLNNYVCMTFHPVTTQQDSVAQQLNEVLCAVAQFPHVDFIVTKANADVGGNYINMRLKEFAQQYKNIHLFSSLGIHRYTSLLRYAKAVIGNSSSGIIEAPLFHIPTIDIGDRQKGRLMADSIIHCDTDRVQIIKALDFALSESGQAKAANAQSLYQYGNTSVLILEEILNYLNKPETSCAKVFFDLPFEPIK